VRELVAEHRRLDAAGDAGEPHAIGLVAAELVADDRGEHGQEARVALAQARVGLAIDAAQRPVEAAVGHPHGDADVGADPGVVGDRELLGDRMALGVGDHVRERAVDDALAVGVLELHAVVGLEVERSAVGLGDVAVDLAAGLELRQQRDVHVQMGAGSLKCGLDQRRPAPPVTVAEQLNHFCQRVSNAVSVA